jgi:hypothetical protein
MTRTGAEKIALLAALAAVLLMLFGHLSSLVSGIPR